MSKIKAHVKRDGTSAEVRVPQDHMLAFVGRRDLGPLETHVYLLILFVCRSFKAEATEMHKVTMDDLTAALNSDEKWVRRAIRKLEVKGFVTVNVGGGRGNPSTYLANPPSLWAPAERGAQSAPVSRRQKGGRSASVKGGAAHPERGAPSTPNPRLAAPPFRIAHSNNQAIQASKHARTRAEAAGSNEPERDAVRVVVGRWEKLSGRTATDAERDVARRWVDNFEVKLGGDGIATVVENVYRRARAKGNPPSALSYFEGAVQDAAGRHVPRAATSTSSSPWPVSSDTGPSVCPVCDAPRLPAATRCWDCDALLAG